MWRAPVPGPSLLTTTVCVKSEPSSAAALGDEATLASSSAVATAGAGATKSATTAATTATARLDTQHPLVDEPAAHATCDYARAQGCGRQPLPRPPGGADAPWCRESWFACKSTRADAHGSDVAQPPRLP